MRNFWERRKSPTRDFIEKYSDEIAFVLECVYYVVSSVIIVGGFAVLFLVMLSLGGDVYYGQ